MPLDDAPNPAVLAAVADLLADHERQDGLSQEDIERVLAARGIAGLDSLTVYEQVSQHGIEVEQAVEVRNPLALRRERQVKVALAEDPALLGMLSHPVLSAQDELVLGRRIAQTQRLRADLEAGLVETGGEAMHVFRLGEEARDRFVRCNLRLVLSVARRYIRPGGLALADLLQEGTIGLMRAVEGFDHTRGYKFSTYATWWIRQAIMRAIDDKADTIRMPVHMAAAVRKLRRTDARLRLGSPLRPTVEQLAQELQWSEERVVGMLAICQIAVVSLDPMQEGDDEVGSPADLIPSPEPNPEEVSMGRDLLLALNSRLAMLSPREERILRLRFGIGTGTGATLEHVGAQFGLTRERIRQLEAKSLEYLAHPARSRRLRVFMGLA